MHMRARYFVITSMSTWTSTVTFMARAYGFATSDVFVIDLKKNQIDLLVWLGLGVKQL